MADKQKQPVVPCPPELAGEEAYEDILAGLCGEAQALRAAQPAATAQDFINAVGRRRWMSQFADYWNIPEDEQLDRRVVRSIDRFLAAVFEAAV